MSGKPTDRYDTMIPFFGKANDKRVRLYLHALEAEFRGNNHEVALTANWNGGGSGKRTDLKNKFFITKDVGDEDAVHSEWHTFVNNLEGRLAGLTQAGRPETNDGAGVPLPYPRVEAHAVAPATATAILNVIKSQAGVAQDNTTLEFFQAVIKKHLLVARGVLIVADAGNPEVDITLNPSRWGDATGFNFKTRVNLKAIYSGATLNSDLAPVAGAALTPNHFVIDNPATLRFNYNLSKYLIAEFLENTPLITSLGNDNFWSTTDSKNDTYFRITNDPNKLFTIDPATGNMVDVSRGSAAFQDKLKDDVCVGTKAKENATSKCVDYIEKCIISGKPEDITACKDFMLDSNFWDVTPSEIEDMLPLIAVSTLQKFGFQYDKKNKDFKSFETVASWLRGLQARIQIGQLSAIEFSNISKNFKLTQYLTKLVNKVNSSPAILNDNYFDTKNFNPNDIRFNNWTPYGLTPRIMMNSNFSTELARRFDLMGNKFARYRGNIQRKINVLPNNGGIVLNGQPFRVLPAAIYMIGGGRATITEDDVFTKQGDDLENLVKGTLIKLKSMGKIIDSNTEREFKIHIEKYKDAENKLVKAITYANKYVDLIELFNEVDTQNVLSIDHLKAFVEARNNYFDKTESRQNSIISAIRKIADDVLEKLDNDSSLTRSFKGPIIPSNI
jgi:hypothetical protein